MLSDDEKRARIAEMEAKRLDRHRAAEAFASAARSLRKQADDLSKLHDSEIHEAAMINDQIKRLNGWPYSSDGLIKCPTCNGTRKASDEVKRRTGITYDDCPMCVPNPWKDNR